MTDRVKGFTVMLAEDMRVDDAESLKQAIFNFRGVIAVEPIVAQGGEAIERERARLEILKTLIKMVKEY